jgi:hypothetical protein
MAALAIGGSLGLASPRPAAQVIVPPGGSDQIVAAIRETIAVVRFEQRLDEYVALHYRLEATLPPIESSMNLEPVRAAMQALAVRIQAARQEACQGDMFTPDVVPIFKKRIALQVPPEIVAAVIGEQGEVDAAPVPRLAVNMALPEGVPLSFMPPRLLASLPPLPPEVQYRFIGRSLVLWDVHANLIVDFLPGALTT